MSSSDSSISTTSSAPPSSSSSDSSSAPPSSSSSSAPPSSSSSSAPPSSSSSSSSPSSISTTSSAPPSSSSSAEPSSTSSVPPSSTAPQSSTTAPASSTTSRPVSYSYITVTDSQGHLSTSSRAVQSGSSGSGTNVGAIAGGVVGGVVGLIAILALLWFFCIRRKRSNNVAFDEKTFDPARGSIGQPIDLFSASQSEQQPAATSPRVEPFPYQSTGANAYDNPHGAYEQAAGGYTQQTAYDPYTNAPMQMPEARNYMGPGGYAPHAGAEGGYGVAAAAGAAGAAGAAAYGHNYGSSYGSETTAASPTPGAIAKAREAQSERSSRLHLHGANSNGGSGSAGPSGVQGSPPVSEGGADVNRHSTVMSDGGRSTVYQHTDMGSVPDEEEATEGPSEVPPNYNSIRR